MLNKKRGQVWVETVVYTLIAFVMIGAVLAYAKPKIEQLQDKAVIEQSSGILKEIDNLIKNIGTTGNIRNLDLGLKKGELKIDGVEDKIIFKINSKYKHSEPGTEIENGNIIELTTKEGEDYVVSLALDYVGKKNITFAGEDVLKTISKSSTDYKLIIENKGKSGELTWIDIGLE